MKILFIASGAKGKKNVIVERQLESLEERVTAEVMIFYIKNGGAKGYFNAYRSLKELLKNNYFDIIHAHYGLCGLVAQFARKNEKLIVSFMGDDLIGSVGKNNKYTYLSIFISFVNRIFAKYYYNYNIIKSDKMFNYLFKNTNCEIIPNGVNMDVFYPMEMSEARKKLGLDLLDVIILFPSNPTRREKNFNLAKDSVEFLGNSIKLIPIDNKSKVEVNYYYNASNCVILSSFHEGSPNVIKEAMACNCPIVSTDVGDVKLLFDGVKGYYISSFVVSDFARKIELAIEYKRKYKYTSGRDRIIKMKLDSKSIAEKLLNVYNLLN